MTTAIYVRISRDDEGDGLGVARQEQDCLALCERRGWEQVEVIADNHVSAYDKRKKRPGYSLLLDGIKNGVYERVVVWHPDRLHRSPRELEDFIDVIEETGCEVATVTAGDFDLATPEGLLVARITGSVARKESDDKSRRLRRKHLELAAAGKPSGGGTRPFGFLDDRATLHPIEADLVRDACRRLLAGETLYGVCDDWNRRGVPTVTGSPWRTSVLKRLVCSGRVCGWREHHGALVAPALHPGIVDRETVERLRVILRDPVRRATAPPRSYLLTGGIARCALCRAALVARPRSDKRRSYVCATGPNFSGCGKIRVLAEPFEQWIVDLLCERVDSPSYARAAAAVTKSSPNAEPLVEVKACEAKIAQLAEDWAADRLTRESWQAARAAVERRLEVARRHLTLVPSMIEPGSGRALAAAWHQESFGEQRAAVERMLARVVVSAGRRGLNRFDKTRFDLEWRI